ncbi:techylectin-5B-like isoform X1 [Zophobas morio]|uniref:techylectin-5B-like isoform X1 n=1 Tax=Zophobas morio TaxID=2755281 RepID=UPI003082CE37
MQKMVSKIVLLFTLLFRNVFLNPSDTDDFSVVFTSKSQPKFQPTVNDPFFVRAELLFEINTILGVLKESVNNLQNIKQEIIEEVENVVEEKISIYEADLKDQLSQTKTEILSETKENVIRQLTEAKNEMTIQMNAVKESGFSLYSIIEKKLIETKNEVLDEISNAQIHFTNLENQLKETKQHIVAETKENVKLEVIENNFKIYDTELKNEFDKTKKQILTTTEQQLSLAKDEIFNGITFELINTQAKIINEVRQCRTVPSDCREVQRRGYKSSGIYRIQPKISLEKFLVWCDMSTRGGGWTYVLNRFDGSENFYFNWTDYKQGFGNLSGEHWLGLDHLYELTNSKPTELLFQLMDRDSKTVYALYNRFQIGSEAEHYQIKTLGSYDGNAGDSFRRHDGAKFSTADNDHSSQSCASSFESGWWFTDCHLVLLTGKYIKNPTLGYYSAIKWYHFHGYNYSLKEARMMIRTI